MVITEQRGIDSQALTPISSSQENKRFGRMWRAPEYGGDRVAFCLDSLSLAIEIYRETGTTWEKINTITPPSLNYLYSVEYFTHNGKSYLAFATLDHTLNIRVSVGDIWIAGIDPADQFLRRVSANNTANRLDPEVLVTPTEVYVYYTEVVFLTDLGVDSLATRHCTTGLGPSQQ